ncbi:hypothetical protein LWI28_020637 [Acer negundo]|uniref:Uncharacterized protein n=1 Tax=Acer negundo TaxID=4023 RepID=A0AAD5IV40_ACENE|nr:hypothetical protein LWI28_020637 [Acer negundo]
MAVMLGAGDSSLFTEHDTKLREADTVRQTRSSSHVSQHHRTDDARLSSVLVIDTCVLVAPSSVPAAPIRRAHLRFMSSTQTVGHNAKRRSHAIPNHLECQFAEVISAIYILWVEVRKSDKERKESDRVREEQYKELVPFGVVQRWRVPLDYGQESLGTSDPFMLPPPLGKEMGNNLIAPDSNNRKGVGSWTVFRIKNGLVVVLLN